jgi:hypothetical protein
MSLVVSETVRKVYAIVPTVERGISARSARLALEVGERCASTG